MKMNLVRTDHIMFLRISISVSDLKPRTLNKSPEIQISVSKTFGLKEEERMKYCHEVTLVHPSIFFLLFVIYSNNTIMKRIFCLKVGSNTKTLDLHKKLDTYGYYTIMKEKGFFFLQKFRLQI